MSQDWGCELTISIFFSTAKFDTSSEAANPFATSRGASALFWLKRQLADYRFTCSGPSPEYWGWRLHVYYLDDEYFIDAIAHSESCYDRASTDWEIQIGKRRTIVQSLLRRRDIDPSDRLVVLTLGLLTNERAIERVECSDAH